MALGGVRHAEAHCRRLDHSVSVLSATASFAAAAPQPFRQFLENPDATFRKILHLPPQAPVKPAAAKAATPDVPPEPTVAAVPLPRIRPDLPTDAAAEPAIVAEAPAVTAEPPPPHLAYNDAGASTDPIFAPPDPAAEMLIVTPQPRPRPATAIVEPDAVEPPAKPEKPPTQLASLPPAGEDNPGSCSRSLASLGIDAHAIPPITTASAAFPRRRRSPRSTTGR